MGLGGVSKILCLSWPLFVDLDLGPEQLFSCTLTPCSIVGVLQQLQLLQTPGTPGRRPLWALTGEDFAVFVLYRLII